VPALDANQRGDLAGLVGADDVVGGVRHGEVGRVARGQALHDVDLLESGLDRHGSGHGGGNPHRPELPADVARAQAGNIGHQQGLVGRRLLGARQLGQVALEIEGVHLAGEPLADLPREVVVAVDQRGPGQHRGDPGLQLSVRGLLSPSTMRSARAT
jgi:hypothetical protein